LIGLDVQEVVDEPDDKQKRAREEDELPVGCFGDEDGVGDHHRQPDGRAAKHGGRFFVPAIALRRGNETKAPRESAHKRRQYQRYSK
jgi:hypothetical protein